MPPDSPDDGEMARKDLALIDLRCIGNGILVCLAQGDLRPIHLVHVQRFGCAHGTNQILPPKQANNEQASVASLAFTRRSS